MVIETLDRRAFVAAAAALGAALAWHGPARASRTPWRERRDLFPDGVASGDPDASSVIAWTRRPFDDSSRQWLAFEMARDAAFSEIVATSRVAVEPESDWTCRVLVGDLNPATTYWYRFTDVEGNGSRVGRTRTAPSKDDARTVRFAFASCQSVNEGKLNAYRRMIWEDENAPEDQQLDFVLHLGDFIYEVVEYPEEVQRRYDRTVFDIGKVPNARNVRNFHVPADVGGYRAVYQAHIRDPDIQDARARFPFVCIGDNHEFSWQGWQSFVKIDGKVEHAQQLKVAANQAWWEYIPSRVRKASGPGLARFDGPAVENEPFSEFDDHGLGQERNNLAALGSMTAYRTLRFGKHVELIVTDLHTYMMEEQVGRPEAAALELADFPNLIPQDAMEIIDAGRTYAGGNPPDTIPFGRLSIANFRKDAPPFSILGREQKRWFKDRLTQSCATWKIWAASTGTLDWRADPQNLPAGLTTPWPSAGYAGFGGGDFGGAFTERAEIYDLVQQKGIEGFVTVSGDRHSFWAGYAAKALPPAAFEPVGVAFITGSLSAPGLVEALEHGLPKDHPLRPIWLADRPGSDKPEPTVNLTMKHGVRSALEYARTGDLERARALTNPDNAPHLEFIDMGGHGYSVVRASSDAIETEFVCIPRPIASARTPDGPPLLYRVLHRATRWKAGDRPRLDQRVLEGDPKLSI